MHLAIDDTMLDTVTRSDDCAIIMRRTAARAGARAATAQVTLAIGIDDYMYRRILLVYSCTYRS